MRLLILLLVTGLCSGIQYPLQYVYHYRAKVSTGIPDINDKHSAVSDLRANLNVYASSPGSITFKLDDVSFGEFNGPKECEERGHGQPPSWVTPQYETQLGRFPFSVERGNLFFNSEEEQWTMNFYKSIVSLFSIAPLKDAFYGASNNHSGSKAYDTTEDTVMGMCRTTYTQHQLTGVAAAQRELFAGHHVTEDVQADSLGEYVSAGGSKTTTGGRKTTAGRRRRRATKRPPSKTSKTSKTSPNVLRAPSISNTLWEVVRSVHLEDCEDRVEHLHSRGGMICQLSSDQCKNLFSRNSHGVYYLRGDENGMRLEKAMIKGAIVISPYGHETEHMETITKQKLALVSVNHLASNAPAVTAGVTVDKLVYELTLPYEGAPDNSYRWAKLGNMRETFAQLMAVHLTAEQRAENKERVVAMLNGAVDLLAQDASKVPVMLNYASNLLYDFTEEEIMSVMDDIRSGARDLMSGVLGEVGTEPAVNVMLKMLKDGELSAFRQVMYFGTLNINLKTAAGLRGLMDFLLNQNMDATPYRTSQSLVNFASVVRRLCLGKGSGSNSLEEFAKQRCGQDRIVEILQAHITTQLQQSEIFWKQMVLVQALVNLRTPEATNALLPFVLGARNCDTMVRAVAMDSLASWNAPGRVYRSKIVLILLDIFENPAESRLLRARALGYLASWQLTSTEWTRLAFATKRPGLNDLAALTYSLIKSTSEFEHPDMIQQRQYAQHALHIAKPSSAAERYSSIRAWNRYNFEDQVGGVEHVALIKDPTSPLPAELALYMRRVLGGVTFYKKADIMIANDNGDLENIAIELFLDMRGHFSDSSSTGRWTNFLNMLKTDLNIAETTRAAVRGLANLVPFAGVQLFIPFEHDMLIDAMRSTSGSDAPYLNLIGPSSFYLNPVDSIFTTVNDLGLPVVTTVSRPTVISYKGSAIFRNFAPEQYSLKSVPTTALFTSSTLRANVDTGIPWSHTQLATGVAQQTSINIPLSTNIEFSWNYRPDRQQLLAFDISPSVFVKTEVVTKENLPYTILRDSAPANLEDIQRATKIIFVNEEKRAKYQSSETGGPFEHTYVGDVKSDFAHYLQNPASIAKVFSTGKNDDIARFLLTPSLKMFRSAIYIDFTNAQSSSFRFKYHTETAERLSNAGKLVSKYGQDSFQDYELCGHEDSADSFTQQTGQQSSDDYMYEQSSQSVQSPDQEFESFGDFGQQQEQVPAQLNDPTEAETVRPSQGIGDVSQPQLGSFLTYLQRQAGWKSRVNGASIRIELEADEPQAFTYELVMASTKCYGLQNRLQQKAVAVLAKKGDPCDTLCLEAEMTQPKINDLDTLPLLLEKDLSRTLKTDFYTGTKCNNGPFHSQIEESQLTAAGLELLISELEEEKCRRHGRVDMVEEFAKRAQYDRVTTALNMTLPETWACRSSFTSSLLQSFMLLRENVLQMKSPNLCASDFQGNKLIHSSVTERDEDGVFISKEKFGQKELTHHIDSFPDWVMNKNRIAFLSDYEAADYCVIDGESVTTFDGMRANFTAGACPVLVSTPCQEGEPDAFAVAVKTSRSGGLAVHVAGQVRQFIINVEEGSVEVNGQPMENGAYVKTIYYSTRREREVVAGHIYRRNGFTKVEIDHTLDLLFKEGHVYVKVADRYRGYMCGLCGNYDNEPSNDLKAPNGCLITDSEQFSKAWTPSTGFDCFAEQQTNPDSCLKEDSLPHDYYQQYLL